MIARYLERLSYAGAVLAACVLSWHVFLLASTVTFGHRVTRWQPPLDQVKVLEVTLAIVPAVIFGSARLWKQEYHIKPALVVQIGTTLIALALSYRFTALVMFLSLAVCWMTPFENRRAISWQVWGGILLLCLVPIDLSARLGGLGAHLVATANCHLSARAVEMDSQNELVCVADGPWLYSEPRYVWIW